MRRFSLYRRGSVWYAQLHNPVTRKYLPGKSTGETDRRAAEHVVDDWIRDGIPRPRDTRRSVGDELQLDTVLETIRLAPLTPADAERIIHALKERELIETAVVRAGPGSEGLISFLNGFWNYESSPYVREKLTHGQRIGRRHCYDMAGWIRTCWAPFFGSTKRVQDVCKADLRDFSLWLAEKKRLQAKSINTAMAAGTVPLRWANTEQMIPANPAAGLMHFSGKAEKRGILTEAEVKKLFEAEWQHERARLGNATSMSTGLRAGEILGLQVRDIGEDRLFIRHSWSNMDGLKSTKTGEERSVPLVTSLRGALLDLARQNPHGAGPSTFIFWSMTTADRPMDFHFLLDGLHGALVRLKLSGEDLKDVVKVEEVRDYWKGRRVCFHSWRHYFAARMADRLEKRKVMLATGHANGAVFDAYADHGTEETFKEVGAAAEQAFGKMLPFKKVV